MISFQHIFQKIAEGDSPYCENGAMQSATESERY